MNISAADRDYEAAKAQQQAQADRLHAYIQQLMQECYGTTTPQANPHKLAELYRRRNYWQRLPSATV